MTTSGATLFQALSHLCSPVQREESAQLAGAGEVNLIYIHMEDIFKVDAQLGRAAWGCWCFSKDSSACPNVFFSGQGVSSPEWKPLFHSCLCGEKDSQSSQRTESCLGCRQSLTAPPGAQPWLLLSCLRDLGQEHQGLSGAWQPGSIPPPHPRSRAGQGQPKAHLKFMVRRQVWRPGRKPFCRPGSGLSLSWASRAGHSPMIVRQVQVGWDSPKVQVGCQCTGEEPRLRGQAGAALQWGRAGSLAVGHCGPWVPRAAGQELGSHWFRRGSLLSPMGSKRVLVALCRWAGERTAPNRANRLISSPLLILK